VSEWASGDKPKQIDWPNGSYSECYFECKYCGGLHEDIEADKGVQTCTTFNVCWKPSLIKYKLKLIEVTNAGAIVERIETGGIDE